MKKDKQIATLDFYLEPTGIMFTADGEPIGRMTKEKYFSLFDPAQAKAYFANLAEVGKWNGLSTLEDFVLCQRLLTKGMSMTEAACFMKVEEQSLRQFNASANQRWHGQIMADEFKRFEDIDKCRDNKKTVVNVFGPLDYQKSFLNLRAVKNGLSTGRSPKQLAFELGVDADAFEIYLTMNADYLDVMK
jgi:hypothetical protein